MPFGVLSSDHRHRGGGGGMPPPVSPMPFGVLSSDHSPHCWPGLFPANNSHQCLSAFCLLTTDQGGTGGGTGGETSPMPFGVLSSDHLRSGGSSYPTEGDSHQCLSAFCLLTTGTGREWVIWRLVPGHQCLSAFCLLTTDTQCWDSTGREFMVTNAFRRSVF